MSLTTNVQVGDPDHAGLHNEERGAINDKPDAFTDLDDTPSSLSGEGGKVVVVNTAGTALELDDLPSGNGASSFTDLDDTPSSLSGEGGKLVAVNSGGTALELVTPPDGTVEANVQTSSYTLVLSDAGKAVEMNVGSANTVTVPPNSSVAFPVGTIVEIVQVGTGQTSIVEGSGVDVRTPQTLVLSSRWSTVSLRKRATDEWVLAGDVEPST